MVDLSGFGAGGPGAIGQLPAVALPLIGATLGALFELDNTGDPASDEQGKATPRRRIGPEKAAPASKRRGAEVDEVAAGSEPEMGSRRAKR